MQIVIDIDEELYNYMQMDEYDEHLDKRFDYQIRFAVKNGTPLPKGHGKLIDADKLKQKIAMGDDNIMQEDWYTLYINVMSDIDSAHAIIESESEK